MKLKFAFFVSTFLFISCSIPSFITRDYHHYEDDMLLDENLAKVSIGTFPSNANEIKNRVKSQLNIDDLMIKNSLYITTINHEKRQTIKGNTLPSFGNKTEIYLKPGIVNLKFNYKNSEKIEKGEYDILLDEGNHYYIFSLDYGFSIQKEYSYSEVTITTLYSSVGVIYDHNNDNLIIMNESGELNHAK